MPIETVSNEPKVEPKAAAAAEASPQAQAGSESAAEAEASAENTSANSEAAETEEPTETEAESEASESETEKDPKDPASKEPNKKKGGFQRRIDKLNARVTAREQELDYWKQQALKGASDPKIPAKVETTPVATDGKPSPDKFETHAAYVEALTDWKTEQKLNERDQKAEKSKLQDAHKKVVDNYNEKRMEFKAKTPDFDDVMDDVEDISVPKFVTDALLSSENGPKLAYELAKNKEDLARICKLNPLAAARELGRFEAKFLSESSTEKKTEPKITKAPAPLAPVRGGGTASIPKTLEEAAEHSFAAYKQQREAEIKKRRQA